MIDSAVLQGELVVEDYLAAGKNVATEFFDLELVVIDLETGRPIPGALIGIDSINRTGTCNDVGKALIQNLTTGQYPVDIIKAGYAASLLILSIEESGVHSRIVKMQRNS